MPFEGRNWTNRDFRQFTYKACMGRRAILSSGPGV